MTKELTLEKLKISERLLEVEEGQTILKSRWDSEFGNGNLKGNLFRILDEIQEALKTQNGRVKSSELWISRLQGAIVIISVLIIPIRNLLS